MNQLQIHKQIRKFLKQKPENASIDEAQKLVSYNFDARNYFFTKADERWLGWLWENGLLDELKAPAKDTSKYSYATPEIRYLVRMAKSKNSAIVKKVIGIITDESLATSEKKFNPELIDQIFRILADWKAEYIIEFFKDLETKNEKNYNTILYRIIVKIISFLKKHQQKKPEDKLKEWIKLMAPFGITITFSIERILKTLLEAKKYERLIFFADCVLAVKDKEDFKVEEVEILGAKVATKEVTPFYISDLEHTEVFEALQEIVENIDDIELIEKIFILLLRKFQEILELAKPAEESFFKYDDSYLLPMYSIDLFQLEKPYKSAFDYKTKALLYTLKITWNKLVEHYKEKDPEKLKNFFKENIGYLDDQKASLKKFIRSSWSWRLYALSQAAKVFKKELKGMIFFPLKERNKEYINIVLKAEYIHSLQAIFNLLSEDEQRGYIETIRNYFLDKISQRKEEERKNLLYEQYGWFFCFLRNFPVFKNFKKDLEKDGFIIPQKCQVGPEMRPISSGGARKPQPVLAQEDFNKIPLDELISKLKTDWKPENLANVEIKIKPAGLEVLIMNRAEQQFEEMLAATPRFFDQQIHLHYLYALLKGLTKALNRHLDSDYSPLFTLFREIQKIEREEFKELDKESEARKKQFYPLATWRWVHRAIAELLKTLLENEDEKIKILFKKHRKDILAILKYLLLKGYPDPNPETESAKDLPQNPFTAAINSVRGEAFEAFVLFVYRDGKRLQKDVKETLQVLIKEEKTRAMMFMYGYYAWVFYYRDKKWFTANILDELFRKKEDKYLKLAAEEGYLSQNLYREIFQDKAFRELYKEWIENEETDYPNQKHFKNPAEALADHLALGFIFLGLGQNDDLLQLFWKKSNSRQQKEFIAFIGRTLSEKSSLSQDIKLKEKLLNLWQWVLKNTSDAEVLSAFGYWVDKDIAIFENETLIRLVAKTIEKSKGAWENEYSSLGIILDLANLDFSAFLKIIRHFFLPQDPQLAKRRSWLVLHQDYKTKLAAAIKSAHEEEKKEKEKEKEASKLIGDLFEKGGEPFWFLEDIVLESS